MMRELLAGYPPATVRYDEMLAGAQAPRPHWERLYAQLQAISPDTLRERAQWVQRQVRESGITYNVYADPEGADRPWELDMLPLIIPAEEWAQVEAAVIQRATLLNKVLLDVYGEQRLVKEGHLPAALIHSHAGFLRPCAGIRHPGDVMLHKPQWKIARGLVGEQIVEPHGPEI